ncbi:transglutaminase family protein [Pinisolibacter sp.]|uniref:transglutaminase family protein n=1 Tax=Pinisolibacter sp. TaxID=2172024 RepID=UPI002FDD0585
MRFSVRHETIYRYSAPVGLGDHLLRLAPRPEGVVMRRQVIGVEPHPTTRTETHDAFGNLVTHLTFDRPTDLFRIVSRFDLETTTVSPRIAADTPALPWSTDGDAVTAPFVVDHGIDDEVRAFAAALAAASGWRAEAFLERLTRTLFTRTDRHIRPDGHAQSAAYTLAVGRGACRDVTVLFMAAARALGIPARFVSGYQARAETPDGRRHLHAWPEVYVPGSGWHGFDPTHGVAVGDGHVALSAAPDQIGTMPIEGGFFGDGVTSTLDYTVEIEAS